MKKYLPHALIVILAISVFCLGAIFGAYTFLQIESSQSLQDEYLKLIDSNRALAEIDKGNYVEAQGMLRMSVDTSVILVDGYLPYADKDNKHTGCKILKMIKNHREEYSDIYSNKHELDEYAYEILQVKSLCEAEQM